MDCHAEQIEQKYSIQTFVQFSHFRMPKTFERQLGSLSRLALQKTFHQCLTSKMYYELSGQGWNYNKWNPQS